MPKYAEKIFDMRTLLKYAKIRQSAKYVEIAYSRFSDMPRQDSTLAAAISILIISGARNAAI